MKKIHLLLLLLLLAVLPTQAESEGLRYICSDRENDYYRFDATEGAWTLVPQSENSSVMEVDAPAHFTTSWPHGRGIIVYYGLYINDWVWGNTPCEDADYNLPDVDYSLPEPLNECFGFYADVETYIVDGIEYAAGTDGWVSFQVPQDAVWVWHTSFGYYEQTEEIPCQMVNES